MGMDRPGIEPSPSRMLSRCDTTTPTAPELSRPRVLKYLLRIAFSAEAVQRERPATKASLPALAPAAERKRKETKRVRRQQKGAVSCAALTATGTVAGATLSSTGAVSGSSLGITGAASVDLLSSATGITGSTSTINNTANAGTVTLTTSGAATAASFAATGALTGATLTITGAASAGPLDCESLDCTFTATSGGQRGVQLGTSTPTPRAISLELTLAAAAQVLDCAEKPCSEPLMRCLHAARLLIEDAAL